MPWSAGVDDPELILRPLANYLRPMLLNSWKERRKASLMENADKIKRLLDNLQKKLDEVSTVRWLFCLLECLYICVPACVYGCEYIHEA